MSELIERLRGPLPLFAVNPGGFAPPVAAGLARQPDAALFIDCERTAIGITEAQWMMHSARAAGIPAILRAEDAQPSTITRYLDCGLDALVVPQIESRETCAALDALRIQHAATAPRTGLVVQIESVAGHDAVDEIAGTRGVDAVLIGPNDLAASMGLAGQPGHETVQRAVADIAARVHAAGLPFGLPVTRATAAHWAGRGARLFYVSLAQLLDGGFDTLRSKTE